jgi:hypothetical protein
MKIAKKIVADEIIAYKVGTQQLLIYWNGLLCIQGDDYQYLEIGEVDEK